MPVRIAVGSSRSRCTADTGVNSSLADEVAHAPPGTLFSERKNSAGTALGDAPTATALLCFPGDTRPHLGGGHDWLSPLSGGRRCWSVVGGDEGRCSAPHRAQDTTQRTALQPQSPQGTAEPEGLTAQPAAGDLPEVSVLMGFE